MRYVQPILRILKYLSGMATVELSRDDLRKELEEALKDSGYTVESFLKSDLEGLPNYELRDIWLMVHDLLEPTV